MNANEVIANRATQILGGNPGEYRVRPNDDVNMSQSTNDVVPAAIRLGILWRLDEFLEVLDDLITLFEDKGREFDGILKSGRTHLQDAVPIRMGQEFNAYATALKKDKVRIANSSNSLLFLGIGGTATGTGLNCHPHYHKEMVLKISEITQMKFESSNDLFESMQSMSDVTAFSGSLRTAALTLNRIANDLRLMASGPSSGLDEIHFPPLQPGSSIMPGKINPVMAEMMNMAMYQVIGLDTTIALASQAGQFELNVMMPIIAHDVFEMMQIMIASMKAFGEKGISGLKANPEKAKAGLERNTIIATALNPLIGYMAAAELVKEALAQNRSILDMAMEKARQGLLLHRDQTRKVTSQEIEQALGNLRKMTEGGLSD
jgi:fumarate hydratase class II